ncbi:MAG: hypothetical protein AAF740_09015 [Bacteroidota bacterium]
MAEAPKPSLKRLWRCLIPLAIAYFALEMEGFVPLVIALGILILISIAGQLKPKTITRASGWVTFFWIIGFNLSDGDSIPFGLLFMSFAWLYFVILIFRVAPAVINFFLGILTFGVFMITGIFFLEEFEGYDNDYTVTNTKEEVVADTVQVTHDDSLKRQAGDKLIAHLLEWNHITDKKKYSGRWEVWESDYEDGKYFRERLKSPKDWRDSYDYWGQVYNKLQAQDSEGLNRIAAMFEKMREHYDLDQVQLAEMVVSSVQYVPYNLILQADCKEYVAEHSEYQNVPCVGGILYGLHTPTEFAAELSGDCDTRSVFLFTVLSKLGYRVAVLNSTQYGHSILGISLPGVGKSVSYYNTRYLAWETTAIGWKAGQLPPEFGNINYWEVVLVSS